MAAGDAELGPGAADRERWASSRAPDDLGPERPRDGRFTSNVDMAPGSPALRHAE